MPDLHAISRRYGLPFTSDGKSLFVAPGRVVGHGEDLIFSGNSVPSDLINRLSKLGRVLYRHHATGSFTVVFRVDRLPLVLEILAPRSSFKRS